MLGYGAMELRGAPRGRDVTDTQAETILHAVLDAYRPLVEQMATALHPPTTTGEEVANPADDVGVHALDPRQVVALREHVVEAV